MKKWANKLINLLDRKFEVFWLKFGHNDCSVKKLTSKKKIYERNTEKTCFF